MNTQNTDKEGEVYEDTVRKIQRTGRDGQSYMVTLPKEMMRDLGWRERQKVTVTKEGKRLIIEDWKE